MNSVRYSILFLSTAILWGLTACVPQKNIKHLTIHNQIAEDASPKVLAAVQSIAPNEAAVLTFEKGTYHFYPDKALELFCAISNHENVRTRTAFPLLNKKHLTVDGQGSLFIFHGKMIPFVVEHSQNIEFKNIRVDWAMPFHSELKVVAHNPKNHTFDFSISEDFPYEIRNGQIWFLKDGYQHELGQCTFFDPVKQEVGFNSKKYNLSLKKKLEPHRPSLQTGYYQRDYLQAQIPVRGLENRLRFEEIKPGLVRVYNDKNALPPIGWVLVAKGAKGLNRIAPAFRLSNTKNIKLKKVTVHHAGGMGLICENSENIYLDAFKVIPSGKRVVSTTADATHFVGCRGKIELKNCVMKNQLDDAMNVHGTYQEVVDLLDDHSLGVRVGHFEQQNFSIGKPGDTLGLVRIRSAFNAYSKLTLKTIKVINGRYQIITFNEVLPDSVQKGDLIENLDAYPEVWVENCEMSGNRARGLLISTPRKTVIRNNYFHTQMDAILMPVENTGWYESGRVHDLTIENNRFYNCNHGGSNRGVIRFVTDEENKHIAFRNILITNNSFTQFDNLILEVSNTDHLIFKNNTITSSNDYPTLYPKNPAFEVKSSKHIHFEQNTYNGKAKVILESDMALSDLMFR